MVSFLQNISINSHYLHWLGLALTRLTWINWWWWCTKLFSMAQTHFSNLATSVKESYWLDRRLCLIITDEQLLSVDNYNLCKSITTGQVITHSCTGYWSVWGAIHTFHSMYFPPSFGVYFIFHVIFQGPVTLSRAF